MKTLPSLTIMLALISLPACNMHKEKAHKIAVTRPESKAITLTEQYACKIQSQRHIEIRALEKGYLAEIAIREGQQVKQGDPLFKVIPILGQQKSDVALAEANFAEGEFNRVKKLFEDKVVSQHEVAMRAAKLAKAQANAELAAAELNFATIRAPFDGIVDGLRRQQGSLVLEGEVLTTLSDNSMLRVSFNVPEARYLEYMTRLKQKTEDPQIELVLANGDKFEHAGKMAAIAADFNSQNGNIAFRADFPNPEQLLRHGQTGVVLIHRGQQDAIVIPQRAAFEILNKRYVFVIDKDNVAHQREIVIQNELDDLFVIKTGVGVDDKIISEAIGKVRDGDKVQYEDSQPRQVAAELKHHAE
jgi:membrane fusion protein, multidrug efflux system